MTPGYSPVRHAGGTVGTVRKIDIASDGRESVVPRANAHERDAFIYPRGCVADR